MLSFAALRILSDPDKVPTPAARLFLRLLVDFDLRLLRSLSVSNLLQFYGGTRVEMNRNLRQLVAIGLLERGPVGRKLRLDTYRVNPTYLLSPNDLEQHFRDTQSVQERLRILPKSVLKAQE
jgi:hypothetical protein